MSTTLKPRTIDVLLMQGDDLAAQEKMLAELQRHIAGTAPTRANAETTLAEATRKYDEFMDAAVERGITLTVTAIPRRRYRALVADHPPRPDNEADAEYGFNVDTFPDALVPECIANEFPSIADRDALLDSLSDGQWNRVSSAAVAVNQGDILDPKARLSSAPASTSDETSESPDRLG